MPLAAITVLNVLQVIATVAIYGSAIAWGIEAYVLNRRDKKVVEEEGETDWPPA